MALWSAAIPLWAQVAADAKGYGDGRIAGIPSPAPDTEPSGGPALSARALDSDCDGIPDYYELETLGSDPFDRFSVGGDFDNDCLADGWEMFYFGGLNIADPKAALKPDGLTNEEKSDIGFNPHLDYSIEKPSEPAKYDYDSMGRLAGVTVPVDAVTSAPDKKDGQPSPP